MNMLRSVFVLIALVSFHFTKAQFKTIAESQAIDFSESGNLRVLQMKDGSTMLFNFSPKGGIVVRPYSSDHKAAPEVKIDKLLFEKFDKNTKVPAVFEISGDVVLFVGKIEGKSPKLYRIIIDGKSGKLKEDKMIGSSESTSGGDASLDEGPNQGFYIKKDPISDNYAVVYVRLYESDRNKVIETVHYGSDNKVISQAFVNSPEDAYKHLRFQDVVVLGKEKVCVLVFGINTKANGGKRSGLFLSTLDAGSAQTMFTMFDATKDFASISASMKYSPSSKKIISVMAVTDDSKGKPTKAYLGFIDPVQKKLERFEEAYPLAAANKSTEMYGEKDGAIGFPQDIYIHNNGSFSIVFEQYTREFVRNISYNIRGSFAFSNYDATGTLQGSYLLPKAHSMDAHTMMTFGIEQTDKYKRNYFINGGENSYIVFNDLFENEELLAKNSKPKTVDLGVPIDGFSFAISGKDIIPKRNYMFGQPSGDMHTQGLFDIADYNMNSNIFVTVKCQKQDKKKGLQLIWLQPA